MFCSCSGFPRWKNLILWNNQEKSWVQYSCTLELHLTFFLCFSVDKVVSLGRLFPKRVSWWSSKYSCTASLFLSVESRPVHSGCGYPCHLMNKFSLLSTILWCNMFWITYELLSSLTALWTASLSERQGCCCMKLEWKSRTFPSFGL